MDDFTPANGAPPLHDKCVDRARVHWLTHSQLLGAGVRTQPGAATIIATFLAKNFAP